MVSPAFAVNRSLLLRRYPSSSSTWWHSQQQPQIMFSTIAGTSIPIPARNSSSANPLQHSCDVSHNIYRIQLRCMAGHNKWSKIRHKKGANDLARAKGHTKAARAIEVASLACQGDMSDIHLQSTISAARAVQLPKDRLERAIERGANPNAQKDGVEYAVRRYDGMIPTGASGKVAVIVETLTENKNRTAANVRHLVTKTGGELLPTGANEWLFENVGLIWISKFMSTGENDADLGAEGSEVDTDELLECALEGGATDVEFGNEENDKSTDEDDESGAHAMIKCEPSDMLHLVQALKEGGFITAQFENQWLVKDEGNKIMLQGESAEMFEKFLSSMDDDLDVTNVFHNATFSDDKI